MICLMKKNKQTSASNLRQKAEELLNCKKEDSAMITDKETFGQINRYEAEMLKLVHELEVHQIELELQNKELLQAKGQAEAAARKFADLYDFAPSGYFTLSKEGKIIDLNFTGSKMLGKDRHSLKNSNFSSFVSDNTRTTFNLFLDKACKSKALETCEVTLTTTGNLPIYVQLSIIAAGNDEECLITAIDITSHKDEKENLRQKEIDERRHAENELQQLSTRLTLAARAGGVGVWEYDIANNILVWDDQMFRHYGVKKEDFSGAYEAWQAGLHPDDRAKGDAEIQMAIHGEKEFDTEFRVAWPDGTIRNIRANAILQLDTTGNPSKLIGTNWDITAQKQSEALIEQTRRNYETFFNTIDDFLFVLDEQGNMIHTNTTVTKRLGYSTEELMAKSVLMVHPAERREEAGRIVGEMLAGTSEFCPVPLITKSGNYISVETRVKAGFWDGKPVIFGVTKDVSKIKLSEEKFSKAFQSNSALMAISSFDGTFLDVNDAFMNALGYSYKELIGNTSAMLGIFENPEVRISIGEQLKQNIPVREVEVKIRTKSGEIKIGLFSADKIYIGTDLCLLTMVVDITERKRIEEDLRKAKIEAEKANIAKSEFLSRMSHELLTPMNSILGFAQLMEMGELTPGFRKNVNYILDSGKHLLELINEVLDISRIEAGRISLSFEPVQLKGIIMQMLDVAQPGAQKRHIKTELVHSSDNLLFVRADRQRLQQVLMNLINNAVKYNIEGGTVLVKTKLQQTEPSGIYSVRISIRDTGLGINPEDIEKLFQPFERIGADKTETEGSGLGLMVVKKLMTAMGGSIGVESVPGEGCTFWVELPLVEIQTTGKGQKKEKEKLFSELQNANLKIALKTGTILYIEDNKQNTELVEQIIAGHLPEIRLFSSRYGKNAVEMATECKPDLILLDLDLPDVPGFEVLGLLLADEKTRAIPVLVVSADAMPHQVERLMNAGAVDYLAKPIDVVVFLQAVEEWMGK